MQFLISLATSRVLISCVWLWVWLPRGAVQTENIPSWQEGVPGSTL